MESEGAIRGDGVGYLAIGSLKQNWTLLENAISKTRDEIIIQKKAIQILQSEKETLEKVLEQNSFDVRHSLEAEVKRCSKDLREKFKFANNENSLIQQEIGVLKFEKTTLQQQVVYLQQKIGELEVVVGAKNKNLSS